MSAARPEARRSTLSFAKLQGAGNGYVAFDGRGLAERDLNVDWSALARRVGRSHFGVGSDGIVVAAESRIPAAAVRMRVFNSDGSEAEMSGNGIRLFVKYALERGIATAPEEGAPLVVETGGGLREVWPHWQGRSVVASRVAMEEPRFELEALPARPTPAHPFPGHAAGPPAVDWPLELGGRRLTVTLLSLGNPHAVTFVPREASLDDFPLEQIGSAVQNHAWFPQRVNFEVAQIVSRQRVRARIYERGEGETLASGTGSTAVVVASRLRAAVDDRVTVELRGGELCVEWSGRGSAFLEGPSVEVFTGEWPAGAVPPSAAPS